MKRSSDSLPLPDSFRVSIESRGNASFVLKTEQRLPIRRARAFSFFEDPRNLFSITPDWLDFRLLNTTKSLIVTEGSEFDYHIRWLGITMPWRSRIINYRPPEEFTDIQIQGPYRSWRHIHRFAHIDKDTFMTDEVSYRIPFSAMGTLVHSLLIKRQLLDIFSYRAAKILEWAGQQRDGGS
jgi:hypothetical protein